MTQPSWRGRKAGAPNQIPIAGWLDVLWRVSGQLADNRVNMLAAGIAFYSLLSLFPAMAALISLWALVFDPHELAEQIGELTPLMPREGARLIQERALVISSNTDTGLSLTALASVLVAMFVASKGVRGLLVGLNIVYGEEEERGFLLRSLVVAGLTLGLMLASLAAIGFVALFPLVIGWLGLEGPLVTLIVWLRWPVLLLGMMATIGVFYRVGPYRRDRKSVV